MLVRRRNPPIPLRAGEDKLTDFGTVHLASLVEASRVWGEERAKD